jgi:hypothetical protein
VCEWCVAHAGEVPTAITCPWTKFGDVGEAGESPDGVAPVCQSPKRGRGLTAITCPWIQFGDVGEAGESPDGVAPVCHPSGGGA